MKNTKRNNRSNKRKGKKSQPESKGKFDTLGGVRLRVPGIGIPRRLVANVRMAAQGYLAAGAAAFAASEVQLNNYYQPLNSADPITTGWGLSFTDGSSTTQVFTPNSWFSAGYTAVRVLSASFSLTAVAGVSGDTMNVFLYPFVGTLSATSMKNASGQPGFKTAMVTNGQRPTTIQSKVRCHDVLGMTEQQYRDNPLTAGTFSSGPTAIANWAVMYATMDGAVTTAQTYFDLAVEYTVEFFDPLAPSS